MSIPGLKPIEKVKDATNAALEGPLFHVRVGRIALTRSHANGRNAQLATPASRAALASSTPAAATVRDDLVQEILPVQRIPLGWTEAGVADDSAQFFFCRAVGDAGGAHHVFFQHHRPDIIAPEA